jgi:hypothetical protein
LLDKLTTQFDDGDYEIVVVQNDVEPEDAEYFEKLTWSRQGVIVPIALEEGSAWQARRIGSERARGDYIFWCDSHVVVRGDDLRRAVDWHLGWRGVLKFGLNYFLDHPARTLYQYDWKPERFWGTWTRRRPDPPDYRIMLSGSHGLIDRSVYEEIGGIHPALGIYGGGEPYLDFKVQMFGYEVRCSPAHQVYHIAERRGYSWDNDDLWRNFMISAYAIGGDEALEPLYTHYIKRCNGVERYLTRLEELRSEAVRLATDDRGWIARHAVRTFGDVLDEFGYPRRTRDPEVSIVEEA